MTKRTYLFFGLVFTVLLLGSGYFYLYKGHRNIGEEDVDYSLTCEQFKREYRNGIVITTAKYLDKVIELEGKVTDVENSSLILDSVVLCYADSITMSQVRLGTIIKVKGRSIGYDELLEYIKLDFTTLVNK